MVGTDNVEGLRNAGLAIIAIGVVITGLVYGSPVFIPLAIATFLWAVLEAMTQGFANLRIGGHGLPRWIAGMLGAASILIGLYLIFSILLGQVDALAAAWPRYVARLQSILSGLTEWLGPERSAKLQQMLAEIELTRRIPALLASTQSIFISFLLILAYIGFLIAERPYIQGKIEAMFPDQARAKDTARLITHVAESIHRYIWIKTLVSLLTAASCYVVLRWLGIDFAETWALLIFALNYIPNIGSIIAVVFPAMVALVQFESPATFFILITTLTAIQFAIGSILEPLMMGNSLNVSPLAIIFNLAFWGSVWGIAGMFLSVPILVMIVIVCASVPSWRWLAILLSKDGRISSAK